MQLAHFREINYRVSDPLRPGQYTMARRIEKSGTECISHEGHTYEADQWGWFDLPDHVGKFWHSRPGWMTPQEVDIEHWAGTIEENDAPVARERKTRTSAKK